jgi:hypothetical protein
MFDGLQQAAQATRVAGEVLKQAGDLHSKQLQWIKP